MAKNKDPGRKQEKNIEEYTEMLKRLQAEFENYIKRVEREKQEFTNYSNHKLLARLLTIADSFEKCLEVLRKEGSEINRGIDMIHKEFSKILEEEGVKPIESIGNKIDPFKHEVIEIVEGEEDDVIVEELQRGYMVKDKVLRPAKVKISKIGEEQNVPA